MKTEFEINKNDLFMAIVPLAVSGALNGGTIDTKILYKLFDEIVLLEKKINNMLEENTREIEEKYKKKFNADIMKWNLKNQIPMDINIKFNK